ncbi:DMT family transporter [Candidatus Odyssella acanthamoebae]|uniref:DMT family transporter n=1 Tax=Candidatus Odyssella acanthamoebae TaxID=91604 RepID=UPI00068CDFA5|nr:DMT family transporter [Candidatus Paracaedibacter acanthamoebae]
MATSLKPSFFKQNPFFLKNSYLRSIFWFILSLFVSNTNDLLTKFLGQDLSCVDIIFWRFLFASITLVPFMIWRGPSSWKTKRPSLHLLRAGLLCLGITLWCQGLTVVPMATVTALSFSIPLFTLALARIFLKELIGWHRFLATLVGFIGILIILSPTVIGFPHIGLNLIIAASMFAVLDIINKKFILQESMLSMLFYSAFFTATLSAGPAYVESNLPSFQQLSLLLGLGIGSNFLLYCVLKAFTAVDTAALAPFRYLELVISVAFGFIFFAEIPDWFTVLGIAVIIPTTLFITRYEFNRERNGTVNYRKASNLSS